MPKTWKDDRNWLRKQLNMNLRHKPLCPETATLYMTLCSHLRGKIHMRSYAAKSGGWCLANHPNKPPLEGALLLAYRKRYGLQAQTYYESSAINSLDDQARWLNKHLSWLHGEERELGMRVLNNAYEIAKSA